MISVNIADPSTLGRVMGLTTCCTVVTALVISPGIRLGISLIYPGKERSIRQSLLKQSQQAKTNYRESAASPLVLRVFD